MGKRDDAGGSKPTADASSSSSSSSAAATTGAGAATTIAAAAQDVGHGFARPEVPVSEVREVVLTELLAEPSLQIRVRLLAALSVPVLRPRQQVVPLDLQSYQEAAPGKGGQAEQALLVSGRTRRSLRLETIVRVRYYIYIYRYYTSMIHHSFRDIEQ